MEENMVKQTKLKEEEDKMRYYERERKKNEEETSNTACKKVRLLVGLLKQFLLLIVNGCLSVCLSVGTERQQVIMTQLT